jgi:DsbC/DsbD-like thiol-disulfide interchange protein
MTRFSPTASSLVALLASFAPAGAQEMPPASITARLLDTDLSEASLLHLEVDLRDGWKTYYKSQELYDTEMQLHWSEQTLDAMHSYEILWPAYETFDFYGEPIKGYTQDVTFPVEITWKEGARPDTLSFDLEIFFCSNLCIREEIPYEIHLSSHELRLPGGDQSSSSSR